jgi:hypothetical protein
MVSGTNRYRDDICKFSQEILHFTRLRCPGFEIEHVEQIACDTNKIEIPGLLDEPTKPVDAEVKIGGDKKLHRFSENPGMNMQKIQIISILNTALLL